MNYFSYVAAMMSATKFRKRKRLSEILPVLFYFENHSGWAKWRPLGRAAQTATVAPCLGFISLHYQWWKEHNKLLTLLFLLAAAVGLLQLLLKSLWFHMRLCGGRCCCDGVGEQDWVFFFFFGLLK